MTALAVSLHCSSTDTSHFIDDYALDRIDFRVRQLRFQFDLSDEDQEDLRNDMVVELLSASKRFDPDKSKRETFINRVLDRFVLYVTRQRCTQQRRASDSPIGFDDVSAGFQPTVNDTRRGEPNEQDLRELRLDLPEVIAKLPGDLQQVCEVLTRKSGRAAAKELGLSKSSLYRAIAEIREHFISRGYPGFSGNAWDTSGSAADVEGAPNEDEVTR
ncbi:MAG: hypothetical protein WD534_12735 [Phycisphaeraceae bacterium]